MTPDAITSFLGTPRFEYEELQERTRVPGVATGLAWTPAGGDILFVEATRMTGQHTLTLTGQLGDVMKRIGADRAARGCARMPVSSAFRRLLGAVRHPRPRAGRRDSRGRALGRA